MVGRERIPDEPSRDVTSRDEPSQAVTLRTDMDKDKELDSDLDLDKDSECEWDSDDEIVLDGKGLLTSTKLMQTASETLRRHYDFDIIDAIAQEVDEKSDGDYPYVERLVRRYYEINEDRGWIGTDGLPIEDTMKWYMQYLDAEMKNGYLVKTIAISEY